jgi:hypothetical protein
MILRMAFPYTIGTPHARELHCAFPYTFGTLVALCDLMDLGPRALEKDRLMLSVAKAVVWIVRMIRAIALGLSASLASTGATRVRSISHCNVRNWGVVYTWWWRRTAFPYTLGTPHTRVLHCAFPYTFGTLVALCELMDLGPRALEVFEAGFTSLHTSQLVQLGQDLVTMAGSRSLSTSGKAFLLSSLVCTISALLVVLQTRSASLAISSELGNWPERLVLSVAKAVVGMVPMVLRTAFPYTLGTPHTTALSHIRLVLWWRCVS